MVLLYLESSVLESIRLGAKQGKWEDQGEKKKKRFLSCLVRRENGEILVGFRYFLLKPTKMQSL